MVSSKCSCSLTPLLARLCLLKEKRNQMSNLDRTNHDKLYNGSRKTCQLFCQQAHPGLSCLMCVTSHVGGQLCYSLLFSLLYLSVFFKAVLFLRVWLHHQSRPWNEICVCACQRIYICALLYLHSINASSPPNSSSRRTRHTTAAVVPLPSVLQGAVIQEKRHPMRRRKKKHKLSDMAALEGQKGLLQYVCTVTKLTGTARAYRRSPKIPWLSLADMRNCIFLACLAAAVAAIGEREL